MIHVDTAENFHPYECNGPGECRHCDRREDDEHDPATCALCDPAYDHNVKGLEVSEADTLARYTLLAYAAANPFYVHGMDRDDLDQEALTAALTAIRSHNPDAGTLAGHIHLSVRRRMITLLKHQKREKRDAVVYSLREDDWVDDTLHVRVEDRERLAAALELIRQMTARQARALIGVAIGCTYREIDPNPKSVDNALAIARAKLKSSASVTAYIPSDDDAPYVPDDDIWVDLDSFNTIPTSANGAGPEHYDDSWLPINLADLPETPPVQPTLGGMGLVYPGKRHVFSGPPESVKTLAAYLIGIQVVREQQNLIVIDFEMGRYEARNRLRELGATDTDLARIRYLEPNTPATPDTMGRLLFFEPALVIIDAAAGAYELQGLDDNKRSDVGRFISLYVKEFFRHDIATIVIDHVVKNTETRGQFAVGSERKVGGVEVHLGFEATIPLSRGGHGLYKIVNHKDRGGYLQRGKVADLALVSDPETHQITWELKPTEHLEPNEIWMPTALMSKVSIYLSALHEPVSRNRILDDVVGRREHVRRSIDHLVRLGYAVETPGERGSKLISHERLFHPNDLQQPVENPLGPTRSHWVPVPGDLGFPAGPPYKGGRGDLVTRALVKARLGPGDLVGDPHQLDIDPDLPL